MKTIAATIAITVTFGAVLLGVDAANCSVKEQRTVVATDRATEQTLDFACGTHRMADISIPDDAILTKISLSRESWPEKGVGTDVTEMVADVLIGQRLLERQCAFTTDGGARYDEKDNLFLESSIECGFPAGRDRKLRIKVESREDFNSKVSVTFPKP